MCGIAGIWYSDVAVGLATLMAFTDSMSHRGPDGSGYRLFDAGRLGLGYRRLSVLDVSEQGARPANVLRRWPLLDHLQR